MKNSAEYATRIKKFIARLKKNVREAPAPSVPADPLRGVIVACLSSFTSESKAFSILKKMEQEFVDLNELRVCRPCEVVDFIGKTHTDSTQAAQQILTILNSIMDEADDLDLTVLSETGKREAKAALEKINGMTPYMVSWVMMKCLQGHCFPVNQKMYDLLLEEELINPKSDISDVQGFLERHISSTELIETYELIRHHADHAGQDGKQSRKSTETASKKNKTTVAAAKKATKK